MNYTESDGSWRDKIRAAQETKSAESPATTPPVVKVEGDYGEKIKTQLKALPLLELYRQWFPGGNERSGGTHDTNVSCFNDSFHKHGDRNPGLSISHSDKPGSPNTYKCQACGIEGDIIDMWAVKEGMEGPDYRHNPHDVPEIICRAGEELLGIPFDQKGKSYIAMDSDPWEPDEIPDFQSFSMGSGQTGPYALNSASGMKYVDFGDEETVKEHNFEEIVKNTPNPPSTVEQKPPMIDWRSFVPPDTPLHVYMETVCEDFKPEEYHLFNFLMLIGLLLGKKVSLVAGSPVYGNLLMCLVGDTGTGKTSSLGYVKRIISDVCPFESTVQASTGIKFVHNPGSGEFLMGQFHEEFPDPLWMPQGIKNEKQPMIPHPGVRGIVLYNEMSTMAAKKSNSGSTVGELVQELYDCEPEIGFGSNAHGKTVVKNAYGSVVTTTQPKSIKRLMSRDELDSGFLNRWIFVDGTSKDEPPFPDPIDLSEPKQWVRKLRTWVGDVSKKNYGVITYTDDAREEFARMHAWIKETFPKSSCDPLYVRLGLLYRKLILLMTANSMEDRVTVANVHQATQLLNYLIRCYDTFNGSLMRSEMTELQEIIIGRLMTEPDGMPQHKLVTSLHRQASKEEVTAAVADLEKLDRVVKKIPPSATRRGPGRKPGARLYLTDD